MRQALKLPVRQAEIRDSERDVLATLSPADREAFLRSLKALYERYRAP